MNSAIRWHELAVTGQLNRPSGYPALEASVLDTGGDEDRPALPGGLSAVLRDQPSPASGVPVRSAMMIAAAAGGSNSWTDGGLPSGAASAGVGVQDPVRPEQPAASGVAAVQAAQAALHGLASWPGIVAASVKDVPGILDQGASNSSKALDVIQHAASDRTAPQLWIPELGMPGYGASRPGAPDWGIPKPEAAKLGMLEPGVPRRELPDPVAAILRAAATAPVINDKALAAVSKSAMAAGDGGGSAGMEAVPIGQAAVSERLAATAQVAASGRPPLSGQAGEQDTSRTAALPGIFGDLQDQSGPLLSPMIAATRSGPDVPAGNAGVSAATAPLTGRMADRPGAGLLAGPQTAVERVLAADAGMGGGGFRDPSLGGADIVPRRTGLSMPADATTTSRNIVGGAQAGPGASGLLDAPGGPASTAGASGPEAARGAQPSAMVALRGDVMLDGRKMGHIVAAGQTSTASLPTVSASAINLRALPVFTGTGAPL